MNDLEFSSGARNAMTLGSLILLGIIVVTWLNTKKTKKNTKYR